MTGSGNPEPGTLLDLPEGTWGEVGSLAGDEETCAKLAEIGFTPGEWFRVSAVLPLGGAIAVALRGTTFALRKNEAACVRVREVAP